MIGLFLRTARADKSRSGKTSFRGKIKTFRNVGEMIDEKPLTRERERLARILASPGFQSSRQTREFLEFIAERSLAGGPPVDQAEIARTVLGRRDFDPTTDASVRKIATQVRQRLERYYETEGSGDDIIVTLPLRSYTPQFAGRAPEPERRRAPRRGRLLVAAAAVVAGVAAAWYAWPRTAGGDLTIMTERGDLRPVADPAPGALRLGPVVGDGDEVRTRLTFRPDHEGQYAGVAVWQSGTRWLSLGRRFTSRNVLTLGYQAPGAGFRTLGEVPDEEGQSGAPVWLRIARRGTDWTGYWSADGSRWNELGTAQDPSLADARAAIFAVNGRRESPSIPAVFHLPGRGATEPDVGICEAPPEACPVKWWRPVPAGDWSLTARIDMPANPSVAGGLFLAGASGRLRLVRYHNDGTQIALIQDGKLLQSIADFPGSPPVYLRLKTRGGRITGECSVDGERWRVVGRPIAAEALGRLREYGALSSRRVEAQAGPAPSTRFYFVQQDLFR